MGSGTQHLDQHVRVEHIMSHGKSSQFYRGALDGAASGVFQGSIYVHPHAQQTKADQSNKTLLLSRDARMNAKPQLEIFADDVECSHGATIGYIDREALFYLSSRGISSEEAGRMLQTAFLREAFESLHDEKLGGYMSKILEEGV